jgi:hypothetical protein
MIPTSTKISFPSGTQATVVTNSNVALILPKVLQYRSVAAFSVRTGGCSPKPFESLNFSVSQGDSSANVRSNFAVVAERLGIEASGIVTCRQMHEDNVEIIDSFPHITPKADAIVTAVPGIYPAVKTADCLPILLLDPVHRAAGAIHAGWRGTVLRIVRKAVRTMTTHFGTNPTDLVAALGPAIGPCCYEVDDVVLKPFRREFPEAEQFIVRSDSGERRRESLRLDLISANQTELIREGVLSANIYSPNLCTSCNSKLFFSYRRDGVKSGRQIAIAGFIP